MSVQVLSRLQFALMLSYYFLFPPMRIGLGMVLISIAAVTFGAA